MRGRIITEFEMRQDQINEFWENICKISGNRTDGFFKLQPAKKPKRHIIIFGGKAYPVDGLKIVTSPQIPVEDFFTDNFDKEAVTVTHYIVSRGRDILIKGIHNRIEKRQSGRLVFYYDDTDAEAKNVVLEVERRLAAL